MKEKNEKIKLVNKICSFYLYGDAEGKCQLYGSNDITKSLFCKDISCEFKKWDEIKKIIIGVED